MKLIAGQHCCRHTVANEASIDAMGLGISRVSLVGVVVATVLLLVGTVLVVVAPVHVLTTHCF